MQDISNLINSIYLGDRFCEKVEMNRHKIVIQINLISRIKEGSKEWNYYAEGDIEHGCLVFDDVVEYCQSKDLPFNDEIYEIRVTEKENDIYSFIISGCNVSGKAVTTDVQLHVRAKNFYIYDPVNNKIIRK